MNEVVVGIVAGLGLNGITIPVLWRYLRDPYVARVFVAVGPNKENEWIDHPKLQLVEWRGEDSHSNLARQRNRMLDYMSAEEPAQWYMLGDNDGMPDEEYFDELLFNDYDYPAVLTGRLLNLDGARYWDVAISRPPDIPKLLPYDEWKDPKYAQGLYFNGNQHLINRAAFELNVPYRPFAAEDTWYVQDLIAAGVTPEFNYHMTMTLQRMHAGLGADCWMRE